MRLLRRLILLFLTIAGWNNVYSQEKKNDALPGAADGVVRDSTHNYVLPAATLAVYTVADSALLSYQLTNNFGEFHFRNLPVETPLKIIASYMGYKMLVKKFTISLKDNPLHLKALNLERGEYSLQDVEVIAVPPVRMNGDTLEFNADAFTLDRNAVAEDLLRKLPGVTVWGDGTITVNGKQVNQVLVEGKPFIGGDTRVAIQNISKSAIDKIQVYQQEKSEDHPRDSLTNVNIRLKKTKRFGHFGKIAAGYGTDSHYEADANFNLFSPLTQISFTAAGNNINKIARNAEQLLRNSTYKGVGASIEYQPDFSMRGINHPNSGGVTFQHDFITDADYYKNNRLTGNYFINNNNEKIFTNIKTITSLGGDSTQEQQSSNNNKSSGTTQQINTRYDKKKNNNTFYASAGFTGSNNNNQYIQQSSVSTGGELQSTNKASNAGQNIDKNISLQTGFQHNGDQYGVFALPRNFNITYSLNAGSSNNSGVNKSDFISLADARQNKSFDRSYHSSSNNAQQHLFLTWGDFSNLIFGQKKKIAGISIQNNLDVTTHNQDNLVKDRDTITGSYTINNYLSGNSHYTTINEMPALAFNRTFFKWLANRYHKILSARFNAQAQFFHQKNISDHFFQNITQSYQRFVPNASLNYTNNQLGYFQDTYNLEFSTSSDYPAIDQLVPLVDSSNLYYIQQGNRQLKATDKKEVTFTMQHNSNRLANTFNYSVNISAGIINSSFADSSHTDSLGRSVHYTVNADGNRYLNISGNLNKAFNFKNSQLQVSINPTLRFSHAPNSINGTWNYSDNLNSYNNLSLFYTYQEVLAINLKEDYTYYHSRQSGINNGNFSNQLLATAISASANCTKKFTIGSNITYNHATSTGSAATKFTIWNANATYRLMKGNNLELKVAALDLLHQNTSINNYGYNNMLTHSTANVLQQYFMFTFSYFPRKFGKKE